MSRRAQNHSVALLGIAAGALTAAAVVFGIQVDQQVTTGAGAQAAAVHAQVVAADATASAPAGSSVWYPGED